jgi:anti-sigma regulatory factor (Ser/Thr protein kinase)
VTEHRLPHAPDAPGLARRLVAGVVGGDLSSARCRDLVLMVSEVVSNAVEHAPPQAEGGGITVRTEVDEDAVRIVVIDGASDLVLDGPESPRTDGEGHYGLLIVDELADRWGLALDGEKCVWLEVDR